MLTMSTDLHAQGSLEFIEQFGLVRLLKYARLSRSPARPLVVFLSGAGHTARVAYGHPGCDRTDFLDYWLEREDISLLALSYAASGDNSVEARADLTLEDWSDAVAEAIASIDFSPSEIILAAWSMGGRAGGLVTKAARNRGITIRGFISLASNPPLPGLSSVEPDSEVFLENGLWDPHSTVVKGTTRHVGWLGELVGIWLAQGREVISADAYRRHYQVPTPIGLQGDVRFTCADPSIQNLGVGEFPLSGAIVPEGLLDYRHSLLDAATWGFVNAQVIFRHWVEPVMSGTVPLCLTEMNALRDLISDHSRRLLRYVPGGHMFFLGAFGAHATACAIAELAAELRALTRQLNEMFPSSRLKRP